MIHRKGTVQASAKVDPLEKPPGLPSPLGKLDAPWEFAFPQHINIPDGDERIESKSAVPLGTLPSCACPPNKQLRLQRRSNEMTDLHGSQACRTRLAGRPADDVPLFIVGTGTQKHQLVGLPVHSHYKTRQQGCQIG